MVNIILRFTVFSNMISAQFCLVLLDLQLLKSVVIFNFSQKLFFGFYCEKWSFNLNLAIYSHFSLEIVVTELLLGIAIEVLIFRIDASGSGENRSIIDWGFLLELGVLIWCRKKINWGFENLKKKNHDKDCQKFLQDLNL